MSKVYETLKKKSDPSVEVYPNIEPQNIPNNAIDTTKVNDGAITTNKIVDNAITTEKIVDKAVTKEKLTTSLQNAYDIVNDVFDEDGNIDTEDINCRTLSVQDMATFNNDVDFGNDVIFDKVPQCDNVAKYGINAYHPDLYFYTFIGYTECDLSSYSLSDIKSAIDFDKSLITDWTQTQINILYEIFTHIQTPVFTNQNSDVLYASSNDRYLRVLVSNSTIDIEMRVLSDNSLLYEMTIDIATKTITSFTNNGEYFYIELFEEKTML